MIRWGRAAALTAALFMAVAVHAQTVEVNGVKLDESVDLRGSKLQLNGYGSRYRTVVKVYAAGLYLTRKAGTPEEVLAAPGPKRMSITMHREIDATELGKLFTRAVEDNMPKADFAKLVPGLIRMGQIFSDHKKLSPGDNFTIDWVPGTGTIISVKGRPQGEPFKEPEFFGAMMGIWLGKSPADARLKEELLGRRATGSGQPNN